MVEAAAGVEGGLETCCLQQFEHLRRELRRALRGVLQRVQRRREAAEVVDRLQRLRAGDAHAAGLPVRRNDNDGGQRREALADLNELRAEPTRFQREHRRAMRNEQ